MKYNMATLKRLQKNGKQDLLNEAWKRHLLKSINKQRPKKDYGGLRDCTHYLCNDEMGESVWEFWIEDKGNLTDEELQEYIDEMEVHNNTPYDCSGLLCTAWIQFHRNPSGLVSFIHKRNLDV